MCACIPCQSKRAVQERARAGRGLPAKRPPVVGPSPMVSSAFDPDIRAAVTSNRPKAHVVATLFADFLMDNRDLLSQVEDSLKTHEGDGMSVLKKLEQRAQKWPFRTTPG